MTGPQSRGNIESVSVLYLMKQTTNTIDQQRLAWFIELLNAGRQPAPPAQAGRKPSDKNKLKQKQIDLLKRELSPSGLSAGDGRLMGVILGLLKWDNSSEAIRKANEITLATQCFSCPQFAIDRSRKLRVYRAPRPGEDARRPTIDALETLTYLIKRNLHLRLKCCPGYRLQLYRGAPHRRCDLWFDGASNKTHCEIACKNRAERVRNQESYRVRQKKLMTKLRQEEKDKQDEFYSREGRKEWKMRAPGKKRGAKSSVGTRTRRG